MASPADSRGLKTPVVRLIWIAPASAPALRLIVAISAAETVLSAVTMTRPDAASTYQAMPSAPERSTAALTAESWGASISLEGAASAAGRAYAKTETTLAAVSSRAMRRRTDVRSILTGLLLRSEWDL